MLRAFEDLGIELTHAWGMTEMSPLGCVSKLKEKHAALPPETQRAIREKQGLAYIVRTENAGANSR